MSDNRWHSHAKSDEHHHHCGSGCGHDHSCSHHGVCECCCHGHGKGEYGDFSSQLLKMADEAWMELLKEKIKEQIATSSGEHLDKLAAMVSEANHQRWIQKMSLDSEVVGFKEKVMKFFHNKR